jgi:hypothetical protein
MSEIRDAVVSYLQANPVTGFRVTEELPWTAAANPLYLKNKKTLYVDRPQVEADPIIGTLAGDTLANEDYLVTVYLATDAKNLPSGYETLYDIVVEARTVGANLGYTQRNTDVDTDYDDDVLVTRFDLNFTKFVC